MTLNRCEDCVSNQPTDRPTATTRRSKKSISQTNAISEFIDSLTLPIFDNKMTIYFKNKYIIDDYCAALTGKNTHTHFWSCVDNGWSGQCVEVRKRNDNDDHQIKCKILRNWSSNARIYANGLFVCCQKWHLNNQYIDCAQTIDDRQQQQQQRIMDHGSITAHQRYTIAPIRPDQLQWKSLILILIHLYAWSVCYVCGAVRATIVTCALLRVCVWLIVGPVKRKPKSKLNISIKLITTQDAHHRFDSIHPNGLMDFFSLSYYSCAFFHIVNYPHKEFKKSMLHRKFI